MPQKKRLSWNTPRCLILHTVQSERFRQASSEDTHGGLAKALRLHNVQKLNIKVYSTKAFSFETFSLEENSDHALHTNALMRFT